MKPLVLEFREIPTMEHLDHSLIEYDKRLNLNINKMTGEPAVDTLSIDTETFTKANGEGSDSDK